MSTEELQNTQSQKTVVAFVIGLIVGGLLVWLFSGSPAESPATNGADETPSADESTAEDAGNDADASADTATDGSIGDTADTTDESASSDDASAPAMATGAGSVSVSDQPAGMTVTIDSAVFPNDEGWIGVRDYENGQLGALLGVMRFSNEQGLVPEVIELQRATEAGAQYAVVFYTESGDREFSLADDVQVEGTMEVFTAQ